MSDLFHKLLIFRTPGIGPARYAELIGKFGTPAAAVDSLCCGQEHLDTVQREMDRAAELGIHYICDESEIFPAGIKRAKNHPQIITVRGNLETLKRPAVGMVGTRHATGAGMGFVQGLARAFAENGYAVASGMAMGTDTAAHTGALLSQSDSCTVAILAGGADYIWPLENERLYHQILERGAIISRMPVGYKPNRGDFLRRNRGIAAISEKLILGEADEKSGSMATVAFATEFERQVFAIPSHPSDSRSVGPNRLIKEGLATICTGIEDFFPTNAKQKFTNHKSENINNDILNRLGIIPMTDSVLAELVKKSVADVRRELVMLELYGRARKTDGGYVKA
ncbi:MAG: DNA-protecting protein DprA [Alphaproteobacteria bacterium]|nr:DNA-protecting protein DprA [Alphaproteobacteria bacterium]